MEVPFLDIKASYPLIREEILKKIDGIVDRGAFVSGAYVREFEEAFASYIGTKHCVTVETGTAALHLSLMALGIGPGDEVLVPVNTFIATAEAVSLVGAVPVFVDALEGTYGINPDGMERHVTPRTKAVVPVHLYGLCVPMEPIKAFAQKHNLMVIEDACQAHGASYKDVKAGAFGEAAAFSFYPGKNLGAWGEGGAITTSDDALAERLRLLRDHGSKVKYQHDIVGGNFRMDEFQAAVLCTKLPHLDSWNEKRRAHAALYRQLLGPHENIRLPETSDGGIPGWHLFVVRVSDRDTVAARLKEKGVATGIHYPVPLHLTPAYAHVGHKRGDFPIAEKCADEILSLPMYPELTEEAIRYVVDSLGSSFL